MLAWTNAGRTTFHLPVRFLVVFSGGAAIFASYLARGETLLFSEESCELVPRGGLYYVVQFLWRGNVNDSRR